MVRGHPVFSVDSCVNPFRNTDTNDRQYGVIFIFVHLLKASYITQMLH